MFIGQIHASDSLFTYPVGKTHQSFQHVDFRPIFNVTDQCPGNVADVCGDDQACRFDFCTTDDTSLAESTRIMTEEIEVMAEVALPGLFQKHRYEHVVMLIFFPGLIFDIFF